MARWQTCNVLQVGSQTKQLWQFGAGSDKFPFQREETKLPTEPLNPKLIKKEWETLLRPKLNVAWMPADKVFIRAIQIPKADAAETRAMIELQLEKLSPLPVGQIAWSYEMIPQPFVEMQTAVVIIVASDVVEQFLGQLEGQGYLADRLELPLIDRLRATKIEEDGVWIYPGADETGSLCMVGWWYGGALWDVSLVLLPEGENRADLLGAQLNQMAWAGELEGWLNAPPRYHVVAEPETVDAWVKDFAARHSVEFIPVVPPKTLAALTGRRVSSNGQSTNLLPPEYATRYRQQFFDQLWMQSLFGVLAVYLFGIMVYFGWTQFETMQLDGLKEDAASTAITYTNTLRLKEQVQVLRDQLDLQYAALDCYKVMAENLPAELTLDMMNFDREQRISFSGTANAEDRSKVFEFNEALLKARGRNTNQLLFARVESPKINARPGTPMVNWSIACELQRSGSE